MPQMRGQDATLWRRRVLDSFIRKITFQEITPEGIAMIGTAIEVMAANEQLDAHKNAVSVRLNK